MSGPINVRADEGATRTVRWVTIAAWVLGIVAGAIKAWATRYRMDPDSISYLDMADAYLRGDFQMALNGWWNPLYTWCLCGLSLITRAHPYLEFPAIHLLNLGIYIAGFFCVRYLMRQMIRFLRTDDLAPRFAGTARVPEWALVATGYSLYVISSLQLVTFLHGADMLLANLIYLASGFCFAIAIEPARWRPALLLGMVLGFGYLAKSVMLPVGGVFLIVAAVACGSLRLAVTRVAAAAAIMLAMALPFAAALSKAKGHLTFSDTGKGNYVLYVSMNSNNNWDPPFFHWQGGFPGVGQPVHPTRMIFSHPAVYEFGTPFAATYGAWYDPSYWYEGAIPAFIPSHQRHVLRQHAEFYGDWFFLRQPALVAGLLILLALGFDAQRRGRNLATLAFFIVPSVGALALYALVHLEPRFIGAHFTVIWLCLLVGIRIPDFTGARRTMAITLCGAVLASALTGLVPNTLEDLRTIAHRRQGSDNVSVRVAERQAALGLQPGQRVAHIGNSFLAFWARLARLHIVAEVTAKDTADYWSSDAVTKAKVRAAMAAAGAVAIITDQPPKNDDGAKWIQIDPEADEYLCVIAPSAMAMR